MTACSETEANVWRSEVDHSIASQGKSVEGRASNIIQFNSPMTTDMKSIGAAFGKPGSFVRRLPVHRSATVGATTDLNQVIIKNTLAVKESTLSNTSQQHMSRSQTTISPPATMLSHVQTLAPRRADRIRLEALLADVWSPSLPYPGMTMRRTEQLKGSADQIIRKLSITSLASSFHPSKRSGSYSSMSKLHERSQESHTSSRTGKAATMENRKPAKKLPLSELLPADFELQDAPAKRRTALRTLTMTIERPFSPLLGNGDKDAVKRRTQSVRGERHGDAAPIPDFEPPECSFMPVKPRAPVDLVTSSSTGAGPPLPDPQSLRGAGQAEGDGKRARVGRLRRLFG